MAKDPRAYRRIAQTLREQITNGQLEDGAQLNINTIAGEWDVSRDTVQAALKILSEENLITRVPGIGWICGQLDDEFKI